MVVVTHPVTEDSGCVLGAVHCPSPDLSEPNRARAIVKVSVLQGAGWRLVDVKVAPVKSEDAGNFMRRWKAARESGSGC